jgi:hypothetical protein
VHAYVEDQLVITPKLKANLGLRASLYLLPDTRHFCPEPRISASYHLFRPFTVKASYSRMNQYLHMLSNTSIGVPVDMWVSSVRHIGPSSSDLFSLGFFYKKSDRYQFSAELYHSTMNKLVRYADGAKYRQLIGQSWLDYVCTGKGEAYGAEFFAEKTEGRVTAWLSYTLSWSQRFFEQLNGGKPFPYEYNRRHQLKLVANYPIMEKQKGDKTIAHSISASFVYTSGHYITFATAEVQGAELPHIQDQQPETLKYVHSVNNLHLPDFHHLDVAYQIKTSRKNKSTLWNISLYNVYNHQNVYYYYKKNNQINQITYFPFLPSLTYTRAF